MKNNTKKLVFASLMAAIACIATMIIKIPTPTKGYVNLGDCAVLLSGFMLGPLYGGLAAGIGSALADAISGYFIYVPATFIIKGVMGVIAGVMYKKSSNFLTALFAGIIAEAVMVLGYFAFEATVMGYGVAAAASILGNVTQGIAGIVISLLLLPLTKKIKI